MKAPIFLSTALSIFAAAALFAQVSPKAPPDSRTLATIEGKITSVKWLNPHVYLYVSVAIPDNSKLDSWEIETGSPAEMERSGIKLTSFKAGVAVRAAGKIVGKNRLQASASEISLQ